MTTSTANGSIEDFDQTVPDEDRVGPTVHGLPAPSAQPDMNDVTVAIEAALELREEQARRHVDLIRRRREELQAEDAKLAELERRLVGQPPSIPPHVPVPIPLIPMGPNAFAGFATRKASEAKPTSARQRVLDAIAASKQPVSNATLAKSLGLEPARVATLCNAFKRAGKIVKHTVRGVVCWTVK